MEPSTGCLHYSDVLTLLHDPPRVAPTDTPAIYVCSSNITKWSNQNRIVWKSAPSDGTANSRVNYISSVRGVFSVDGLDHGMAPSFFENFPDASAILSVDCSLSRAATTFYQLLKMSAPRLSHALVVPLLRVIWVPGMLPHRWWYEEPAVYELTKPNDLQVLVDSLRSKSTPPLRTVSVARASLDVAPTLEPQSSSIEPLSMESITSETAVAPTFAPKPPSSSRPLFMESIISETAVAPTPEPQASSKIELPPSAYVPPHMRKPADARKNQPQSSTGLAPIESITFETAVASTSAPEPQSLSKIELPPSAYVPPHKRKSASASTRQLPPSAYVPRHLRNVSPSAPLTASATNNRQLLVRFVYPDLWRRITAEREPCPMLLDRHFVVLLQNEAFKNAVRRGLADFDVNKGVFKQVRAAIQDALEQVTASLSGQVRDPFWRGPTDWDPVDRRSRDICYSVNYISGVHSVFFVDSLDHNAE
ncbi:hypothetical protein FB567DRAFT_590003 [Paraphoma chrysanthemicola]|uniref:Uncharacterized protein n=1 Tax=Paraphoma chrysanthemicola TaxID=798071 RepID=A0A8K0RDG8_9PLEO|nr:hypothetical protein FB567DRAFT_590003 [Paraphoma chrysanthemicola]